ncbi:MAG: TadE/TadG family type IV pilus assembly protein [Terriglobia bacterium]
MRRNLSLRAWRSERGQSLIETALILPILLLLTFNAINFGYFFFVAVNLTSAPRSGVQYAILGFQTPQSLDLPPPGPATSTTSISFVTYEDMRGVLTGSSSATVQVCSSKVGPVGVGGTTACVKYPSGSPSYTPAPDPEAPLFRLARVDVVYQLTPIIPSFVLPTPAGPISLALLPTLNMHRQVSMREMN